MALTLRGSRASARTQPSFKRLRVFALRAPPPKPSALPPHPAISIREGKHSSKMLMRPRIHIYLTAEAEVEVIGGVGELTPGAHA